MADTASPTKMKKLPFKPTALRKAAPPAATPHDDSKEPEDEDDGLALFRRSKEMAPIVARDRERRLQKSKKQKEAEERRRTSAEKRRLEEENMESELVEAQLDEEGDGANTSFRTNESMTATDKLVTPPPSKRTRTGSSSSKTRPVTPKNQSQDSPSARRVRSHSKHSTPRKPSVQTTPSGAPIISLDSDPEDDLEVKPIPTPTKIRENSVDFVEESRPQTQTLEESQIEEEDEFAEYIRKAEEEKKRSMASQASEGSSNAAKVNLLVTSSIDGTRNCGIKVFLDKPLHLVRTAWVSVQQKRQVALPVAPNELILTWRGAKVYNYSTLYSLGLRPYGDGVVADGSRRGLSADGSQVHMEVWTPDMFKQMEEEEERRRRALEGELSDEEVAEEEEEPQPEVTLKVILRARDLDEVRLRVRPATTAETVVTGFRAQSGLSAEKDVTLWFDGGVMQEHDTMEDVGIEDMDVIEVHIK